MRDRLIELLMSKSCRNNKCPDVQCCDCECLAVFDDDAARITDAILADGWMRPPCKVGDKVYCILEDLNTVAEGIVRQFLVTETIFIDCIPCVFALIEIKFIVLKLHRTSNG